MAWGAPAWATRVHFPSGAPPPSFMARSAVKEPVLPGVTVIVFEVGENAIWTQVFGVSKPVSSLRYRSTSRWMIFANS